MTHSKELWTCPKCGHKFVTKSIWHSCGNYDLDHHFENKDLYVYELFEKFRSLIEGCGPVICYPQKTRIVFQERMRFAHCLIRKKHLLCALILTKERSDNEKLVKIEFYGGSRYGHLFMMEQLEDFDDHFMELIREAYLVGQQKITWKK